MKKILIIAAVAAVLGASIGYYLFQKPVQSLEDEKPALSISAADLFDAYEIDETTAGATYTSKIIEVSGKLSEVMKNEDGSTTLLLETAHPIFGIKCRLDSGIGIASFPEPGTMVQLKGHCTGFNADVELNQCILY